MFFLTTVSESWIGIHCLKSVTVFKSSKGHGHCHKAHVAVTINWTHKLCVCVCVLCWTGLQKLINQQQQLPLCARRNRRNSVRVQNGPSAACWCACFWPKYQTPLGERREQFPLLGTMLKPLGVQTSVCFVWKNANDLCFRDIFPILQAVSTCWACPTSRAANLLRGDKLSKLHQHLHHTLFFV